MSINFIFFRVGGGRLPVVIMYMGRGQDTYWTNIATSRPNHPVGRSGENASKKLGKNECFLEKKNIFRVLLTKPISLVRFA